MRKIRIAYSMTWAIAGLGGRTRASLKGLDEQIQAYTYISRSSDTLNSQNNLRCVSQRSDGHYLKLQQLHGFYFSDNYEAKRKVGM